MSLLFETSLPNNYSTRLLNEQNYDIGADHIDKIFETAFNGVSGVLNSIKTNDKPAVFTMNKLDGSFVVAAIVKYYDNKDEDHPGNWSLVWTFNQEDVPEDAVIVQLSNSQCHPYFRSFAGDKWGMTFEDSGCLINVIIYAFDSLKKWLDENAKQGEVTVIEQEGVFQARVAVENGEKVFAIEPMGEIKNLIKDDAAIEK